MFAGYLVVVGCLGFVSRRLVVVGYLARELVPVSSSAGSSFEALRHSTVQQPAPCQTGFLVHQLSQALMAELIGRGGRVRVVDFHQQTASGQLLQGRDGFGFTAATGIPDGLVVKGPLDDGRGAKQLAGALAHRVDARAQHVPDRRRHWQRAVRLEPDRSGQPSDIRRRTAEAPRSRRRPQT